MIAAKHLVLSVLAFLFILGVAWSILEEKISVSSQVLLSTTGTAPSREKRIVDLGNYLQLRSPDGKFLAYYPDPSWEAAASEALTYFARADRLLQRRLGLSLRRFGLVFIPYQPGVRKIVLEQRGWDALRRVLGLDPVLFPMVIPPEMRSFAEAPTHVRFWLHWVGVHEGVEGLIASKLYFKDRRARWIGDGLAEYSSYRVTQELDPEVACEGWNQQRTRLRLGLEQGMKTYNLIEDFRVVLGQPEEQAWTETSITTVKEQVGYGIAFAIWHQIAQRYGEDTIRRFWERLRQRPTPTAEDAARILQDLTGEDIGTKIQAVDLEGALRLLNDSRC